MAQDPQEQLAVTVPARTDPKLASNLQYIMRLILGKNTSSKEKILFSDPHNKLENLVKSLIDPDNREAFTIPPGGAALNEHDDIARLLGFQPKSFNSSYPFLDESVKKGMLRHANYQSEYSPGRPREMEQLFHFVPRPETNELVKDLWQRQMKLFPSRYASTNLTIADPKYKMFEEPISHQNIFGERKAWGHHPAYRGENEAVLDFMERVMGRR